MIGAKRAILLGGVPGWVLRGAKIDLDFTNGRYYGGALASLLSCSRASQGTDLLPSSASGDAYNTFGNNILRITQNKGLRIEEARTNQLLNSAIPATQTTASLGTGTYTLWVNGAGSALASGGTATIAGAAPASNGSPNTFTVTVAGTVVVTVTNPLNAFQLELGAFGTSLIVTGGTIATRAADVVQLGGSALTVMTAAQASAVVQAGASSNPTGNVVLLHSGVAGDFLAYYSAATTASSFIAVGSHLLSRSGAASYLAGSTKTAVAFDATGRSLTAAGLAAVSDAFSFAARSAIFLGNQSGATAFWDGYLQRLSLWTSRLPDATLKALTQ